jgi:16S rRNA (guanine966-N2)-methyltransferase
MLRIIAGTHRSRKLAVPDSSDIRPTTDKAREALFSILNHRLGSFEDARVLDACCGSGAAGLEALSRGAGHAVFMDNNPKALELARRNSLTLKELEKSSFISADICKPPKAEAPCHLLFLDPPYNKDMAAAGLAALTAAGWAAPSAFAAVEVSREESFSPPKGWSIITERIHGPAQLIVLEFAS